MLKLHIYTQICVNILGSYIYKTDICNVIKK